MTWDGLITAFEPPEMQVGNPSTSEVSMRLNPLRFTVWRSSGLLVALALLTGCDSESTGSRLLAPEGGPLLSSAGEADAETLFRGIAFGDSHIADSIPEIRDNYKLTSLGLSATSVSEVRNLHNQILNELNVIDPTFLDRFKTAMNSGDQVAIEAMLDTTGLRVNDAVHRTSLGDTITRYADDAVQLQQQMDPYLNADGYMELPDTAISRQDATDGYNSSVESGGGGGGGGCIDGVCPEGVLMGPAFAVYIVIFVHAGVGYNVALAMTVWRWVAVWTPKKSFTADTNLLRDQTVNSIAQRLALTWCRDGICPE